MMRRFDFTVVTARQRIAHVVITAATAGAAQAIAVSRHLVVIAATEL